MTAPQLDLELEADAASGLIRFRLRDGEGQHLGAHQIRIGAGSAALWEGVFDTRSHVERYQGGAIYTDRPATAEDLLERLGVFLGQEVLGSEITGLLAEGVHDRTLLVRLPELTGKEEDAARDRLAAALARVPWEIARPAPGEKALMERNLVVRAVIGALDSVPFTAAPPARDEPLRVLLVFAEAPGSRALAMRLERETLLDLFYDEVMPHRRVRVDVLCHGVSRDRLRQRVEDAGGYHIVHWSGHGHHDLLELYGDGGDPDRISGRQLLELFSEAGGFLPSLVFLSACLSGAFVQASDWDSLRAALLGSSAGPGRRTLAEEATSAKLPRVMAAEPGYAGTALALLRAGVPQAIAMRYEVGDPYARDLAQGFYRRLLAQQSPKSPAKALALTRAELLRQGAAEHGAVDHATPLVIGQDLAPLAPPHGRSAQLGERRPQPQPLLAGGGAELDRPASFVGRGTALTELRARWLEAGVPAVAVVQGLAGLGKTALVAEAIHLWHRSFDGVFAFQSKPAALTVDDFLRRLDQSLALYSRTYREACDERPNRRIFLPPRDELKGETRYQLLRDNLLEALRDERLLLVLDNFEAQLETVAGDSGYLCADRKWDSLLEHLAAGLPETGSRLVLTSRHRLAALAGPKGALTLALGPLPMEEAALVLQESPALRGLAFGDEEGWALARRLLAASRGHPLILTRLGTLAGDRPALAAALSEIEARGFAGLPDLFAGRLSEAQREAEHRYLEDVAIHSVDLLLKRLTPDARRLLWIVTRASEPIPEALLEGVWWGQSLEQEGFMHLRSLLSTADPSAKELQSLLDEIRPEISAMLTVEGEAPDALPIAPLLTELTAANLVTLESDGLSFHELVKERASAWMDARPAERGNRTEVEVWRAYGERYKLLFEGLRRLSERDAPIPAVEAGRRGLAYFARAGAFEELAWLGDSVVHSTNNPLHLRAVIAELDAVADSLHQEDDRLVLRLGLAAGMLKAGRLDEALRFFEEAVVEASAAGKWAYVGAIYQNWAIALAEIGQFGAAKEKFERAGEHYRQSGLPLQFLVSIEVQALRVDVIEGEAKAVLPEIERRLEIVRGWWRQSRHRKIVPDAPDFDKVGRTLVVALDVAREANMYLERWEACLELLDEIEVTQQVLGTDKHEMEGYRFNRHGPLLRLGRLDEAQVLLENNIELFREAEDYEMEGQVLSALADLWSHRRDFDHAIALERQALAVRNRLPDLVQRSVSHGNLSLYLNAVGQGPDAALHLLARFTYDVLTEHRQHFLIAANQFISNLRHSAVEGRKHWQLPRLADLLSRQDFDALRQAVIDRGTEIEELQKVIDELVGHMVN